MHRRSTLAGVSCTVLLAVIVAWAPVSPASAWAKLGCKYPSKTINYGLTVNSAYQATFKAAASSFTSATDVTMVNKGVVSVANGINTHAVNYGNVGYDGKADPCTGATRGTVSIRLNTYFTDSYSSTKRQGVAAHEFGHALGLAHVNPTSSLMYGSTPGRVPYKPASDDITGINALY